MAHEEIPIDFSDDTDIRPDIRPDKLLQYSGCRDAIEFIWLQKMIIEIIWLQKFIIKILAANENPETLIIE